VPELAILDVEVEREPDRCQLGVGDREVGIRFHALRDSLPGYYFHLAPLSPHSSPLLSSRPVDLRFAAAPFSSLLFFSLLFSF
jgi:hypothetical protein